MLMKVLRVNLAHSLKLLRSKRWNRVLRTGVPGVPLGATKGWVIALAPD
jgi:hypothetical protein